MDEKKLNSLITGLLKMAVEQEQPGKYNTVIATMLQAEGIPNLVIMEHRGMCTRGGFMSMYGRTTTVL